MALPTEADNEIGEIDLLLSLVLGKLKNMRFCMVPVPNERRANERLRNMERYRKDLREALVLLANQTLRTADQWLALMTVVEPVAVAPKPRRRRLERIPKRRKK